jgi:Mn-dependent DtxR family transcriptional regulator
MERIYQYLTKHGESKTNDIAEYIDLSPSRTRVIFLVMENIEII